MIFDKDKRNQFVVELAQSVGDLGTVTATFGDFYSHFQGVLTPTEREDAARFGLSMSDAMAAAGRLLATVRSQTDLPPQQN
jgi:hypothetical protein